ncbi:response regulator [Inquilinus sp. CAU 1745]|uniref:response regulator n=1 Tax=Inquilinus sp. CAU 1745 TaxID=3140369 RepID=UPI00325C0EF2
MTDSPFRPRILIADDEEAVREFVRRAMEHGGYHADVAADGLQALETLHRGEKYDLLITDIVMPGLDGIELALKAAKDFPDLTILMMTGYAAEKQRAYGLESLIHKVLSKPFSLKQITEAVREALRRG